MLVDHVKTLSVILQIQFTCYWTTKTMYSACHLLRLLHSQGLSTDQLSVVFAGLIVSRRLYAFAAWGVFISAAEARMIDAFLKRAIQ